MISYHNVISEGTQAPRRASDTPVEAVSSTHDMVLVQGQCMLVTSK